MIFHRGRLPNADQSTVLTYGGQSLEMVKTFCYLGFWLTVQLSYTRHLEATVAKARARIGLLFAKLPLVHVPLHLAIEVFQVYIAPFFHYGLALWKSQVSAAALQSLDALWTKYLKRYLCVPASVNNAIVLHITDQQPLTKTLQNRALHQFGGLSFPESLSGLKLTFIENVRRIEQEPYNPIPSIPSSFWSTRIIEQLPVTMFYRKRLMHEIFDLDHREICTNTVFHTSSNDLCTCKLCGDHAHPYHSKHCT